MIDQALVPILLAVIAPIFSIIGLVIGSVLQRRLQKTSEMFKVQQSLKIQAYVDFLRSVANIAIAKQRKENDFALLADAKARITIYGSQVVIEALANWARGGEALDNPERTRKF